MEKHEAGQPERADSARSLPERASVGRLARNSCARWAAPTVGGAAADGRTRPVGSKSDACLVSAVFPVPAAGTFLEWQVVGMRILHHRPTQHFVALLVGCRCGRRFLHRLDRPVVACLQCGCLDEVARMIDKLRATSGAATQRAPKAARRARPSVA
jgi:hypothetical protein